MDDEQIDRALAAFDLALRHVRASVHAGKVYGMDSHLDLWMVRLAVATEGVKALTRDGERVFGSTCIRAA